MAEAPVEEEAPAPPAEEPAAEPEPEPAAEAELEAVPPTQEEPGGLAWQHSTGSLQRSDRAEGSVSLAAEAGGHAGRRLAVSRLICCILHQGHGLACPCLLYSLQSPRQRRRRLLPSRSRRLPLSRSPPLSRRQSLLLRIRRRAWLAVAVCAGCCLQVVSLQSSCCWPAGVPLFDTCALRWTIRASVC